MVGTVMGSALVMASEDNAVGDLLPRVLAAVSVGVLASAPVSLPLGLLGGAIAATMLARAQAPLTGRKWVGIGFLSGAVLGSCGSGLYCVSFNGTDAAAVSFFLAIGGLAGATSGSIVGAWCARKQISLAEREA